MLNPAIGKLINNSENRYKLVKDIAKEARNISAEAEKNKIRIDIYQIIWF